MVQTRTTLAADPYAGAEEGYDEGNEEEWEALRDTSVPKQQQQPTAMRLPPAQQWHQSSVAYQQQDPAEQLPAGVPVCNCGQPCAQRTSNTPANPNRCAFVFL